MDEHQSSSRGLLKTLESLAKFLAGLAAVIGSIWIPIVLNNYSEQSRRTQLYMQIMSEREKSDTSIRESMFETLLTNYLGAFKDDDPDEERSFSKRIMFLDLLSLNFQEYLNAKPLFEDLSGRLDRIARNSNDPAEKDIFEALHEEVKKVAARIASKQAATLSSIGLTRRFSLDAQGTHVRCLRLYDVTNRKELKKDDTVMSLREGIDESCRETNPAGANSVDFAQSAQAFPSIDIELIELGESKTSAIVEVTAYEEFFNQDGILAGIKEGKESKFEVSFFDLPYMDNTKLFDGSRFSLVLRDLDTNLGFVELSAVIFKEGFMTLRDRPLFDEMLHTLKQ